MIDLLFLAHGRQAFSAASAKSILANTNWKLVRCISVYFDGENETACPLAATPINVGLRLSYDVLGGPVAIMADFLRRPGAPIFAKLDNDVIVPPGWLDQCLEVMDGNPELDLLGIEPPQSRKPSPGSKRAVDMPELLHPGMGYAKCDAIGGIGLMRRRAFEGRPALKPHSVYGGFTDWQIQNEDVVKGWICPPLKCFLLDRLPFPPWSDLSRKYIAMGQQRAWTNYALEDSALWDWWSGSNFTWHLPASTKP